MKIGSMWPTPKAVLSEQFPSTIEKTCEPWSALSTCLRQGFSHLATSTAQRHRCCCSTRWASSTTKTNSILPIPITTKSKQWIFKPAPHKPWPAQDLSGQFRYPPPPHHRLPPLLPPPSAP